MANPNESRRHVVALVVPPEYSHFSVMHEALLAESMFAQKTKLPLVVRYIGGMKISRRIESSAVRKGAHVEEYLPEHGVHRKEGIAGAIRSMLNGASVALTVFPHANALGVADIADAMEVPHRQYARRWRRVARDAKKRQEQEASHG